MENSTKGDPRGDVVARGIVSEELARVMYERYGTNSQMDFHSIIAKSNFTTGLQVDLKTFFPFLIRLETHSTLSVQDPCFALR
jgi:hypothetical protein